MLVLLALLAFVALALILDGMVRKGGATGGASQAKFEGLKNAECGWRRDVIEWWWGGENNVELVSRYRTISTREHHANARPYEVHY